MVHRASRRILAAALLEDGVTGRPGISLEVVEQEDLLDVGEIVLPRFELGILAQVLDGRDGLRQP
jgi:hypothetical protein